MMDKVGVRLWSDCTPVTLYWKSAPILIPGALLRSARRMPAVSNGMERFDLVFSQKLP